MHSGYSKVEPAAASTVLPNSKRITFSEIELAIYWDRAVDMSDGKPLKMSAPLPHNGGTVGVGVQFSPEKADVEVQTPFNSTNPNCRGLCASQDFINTHPRPSPRPKRSHTSKTGNHASRGSWKKGDRRMSEYKSKYGNPNQSAEAERRILKDKILRKCCFHKGSVF
jgi:hypothetical protein